MTRFARATGSKSSNERIPEKATPWRVMQEDMQRKKQETEENKEREKMNVIRQKSYDDFLSNKSSEVKTEWAEFPDDNKSKKNIMKKMKKSNVNKVKKTLSKNKINLKNDMMQMLKPDPEIDSQVEKLTSEIVKVLNKENLQKKNIQENNSNNDDAPEEISSKIETPKIKLKKPKLKKSSMKIPEIKPVNSENIDNDTSTKLDVESVSSKQISAKKNKRKRRKNTDSSKEGFKKTNVTDSKDGEKADEETNDFNKKPKQSRNDKKCFGSENNNTEQTRNNFVSNPNFKQPNEKWNRFQKTEQKLKVAKVRDNNEHKRRKPDEGVIKMNFNGKEIEVVKFDGFPVKKQDAERLGELRKQMISKGIPHSAVRRNMILERRKAEKTLSREKKRVCFHCRKAGHMLSECPELNSQQVAFTGTGICFKCGSTEHTHFECKVNKTDDYKFATCFICKEQGHIARQCPDNPKGLYPEGGACKLCGDVTHLKKDCPQQAKEKEDNMIFLQTISDGNIDSLDNDWTKSSIVKTTPVKNKVIKF